MRHPVHAICTYAAYCSNAKYICFAFSPCVIIPTSFISSLWLHHSRRGPGLLPVLGSLPRAEAFLRLLQEVPRLQDHQRVPLLRQRLPLLPLRHRQPHLVQPDVTQVQVGRFSLGFFLSYQIDWII